MGITPPEMVGSSTKTGDDVINVAGHRLSTGSMEAIVASHPLVAECAVIGVQDQLKGQIPRAFVVLKFGADIDPAVLEKEIVKSMIIHRLCMTQRKVAARKCSARQLTTQERKAFFDANR